MISIRFFTSAALRPHEEVPGEVLDWLPRAITVEYEGDAPVTGVWRSRHGERRICWYGTAPTAELIAAHVERHGDEPFWIIDRSTLAERKIAVLECDEQGRVQTQRVWELDKLDMPKREQERGPDGSLRLERRYECLNDGVVTELIESIAGRPDNLVPSPHRFPAPEIAGEPFPCGRRLLGPDSEDGARLVESIAQNYLQARAFAVYRRGETWQRGLVTIATTRSRWNREMRSILDLDGPGVAPLLLVGRLEGKQPPGYPYFGVLEALPEGRSLDEVASERPLSLEDTLAVALELAATARRAHAAGRQLGGIYPELVYLRREQDGFRLAGIAHRGAAVIAATSAGDAIPTAPVFTCDDTIGNDTQGLAHVVWYALTGEPPFEGRNPRPWRGPAHVGRVLERLLLTPREKADFEAFVGELMRVRDS